MLSALAWLVYDKNVIVIVHVECLFSSWQSLGESNSSHQKDFTAPAELNEGLK